jgi:hypothetical protein
LPIGATGLNVGTGNAVMQPESFSAVGAMLRESPE